MRTFSYVAPYFAGIMLTVAAQISASRLGACLVRNMQSIFPTFSQAAISMGPPLDPFSITWLPCVLAPTAHQDLAQGFLSS